MNSISWLIYLAGMASGVKAVLSISAVILLLACAVILVSYVVVPDLIHVIKIKAISLITCVGAACALLAAIVPSERTVLMIAASELDAQAWNSEAVSQLGSPAQELVNQWIRNEIRRLTTSASQ